MATTTQALSPAEAQPVAFTAEYLSWGASYFTETSCEHMIGRGLYSVGVIVVAPVGILYHLSMAAYGALAQLRMDEGKEKSELSTWAWQHLDAAASDFLGWVLHLSFRRSLLARRLFLFLLLKERLYKELVTSFLFLCSFSKIKFSMESCLMHTQTILSS